jgi:hypothetical protein
MGDAGPKQGHVTDILGIKPVGEVALVLTKAAVDAASTFLSKLCMPATEELGLIFRDEVARWRTARAVEVTQRAQAKMRELGIDQDRVSVHPRLGITVIESRALGPTTMGYRICGPAYSFRRRHPAAETRAIWSSRISSAG